MKKLMIAAAAAAMVSGAFASGKAQVYDFSATIKTGVCKAAKVSKTLETYFNHGGQWASINWGYTRGDEIGLRKQQSVKLGGVIWGCDCDTIARPFWGHPRFYTGNRARFLSGYMFWNLSQGTDGELYWPFSFAALPTPAGANMVTTFNWLVLNRIDTMTKCEGTFVLNARWPGQRIVLVGSGFGTVKKTGCDTYVNSISGNVAGWRLADNDAFGCVFCDANGCVVGLICDSCYEVALGMDTRAFSAATGTWKIKYNAKATKRLSSTPYISRAYTFPKKSGLAAAFATAADALNAWAQGLTYGEVQIDPSQDEGAEWEEADEIVFGFDSIDEVAEDAPALVTVIQGLVGTTITETTLEEANEAYKETLDDDELETLEAFESRVTRAFGDAS